MAINITDFDLESLFTGLIHIAQVTPDRDTFGKILIRVGQMLSDDTHLVWNPHEERFDTVLCMGLPCQYHEPQEG